MKCQDLTSSNKGGPHIVAASSDGKQSNDIQAEIFQIDKDLTNCFQYIKSRKDFEEGKVNAVFQGGLHDCLDRIEEDIDDLIEKSESNPSKARRLLHVDCMSRTAMEANVREASTILESGSSSPESLEHRYLQVLTKTIHAAMSKPHATPSISTGFPSGFTPGDVVPFGYLREPKYHQDFLDIIRILQTLEGEDEPVSMDQLLQCIEHLGCTLMTISFYQHAIDVWSCGATVCRKHHHPKNPNQYLARYLRNMMECEARLGHHARALELYAEIRPIFLTFCKTHPAVWRPALSLLLDCAVVCFRALRKYDNALSASKEAISTLGPVSKASSYLDLFNYARAHAQFSSTLKVVGRHDDALREMRDALSATSILSYQDDIAPHHHVTALDGLSRYMAELGLHEYSLQAIDMAINVRKELLRGLIDVDLAAVFIQASSCQIKVGNRRIALRAVESAIEISHFIIGDGQGSFDLRVLDLCYDVVPLLLELGRSDKATEVCRKAITTNRVLAEHFPPAHKHHAWSIFLLHLCYLHIGDYKKASALILDSMDVFRTSSKPEATYNIILARALLYLARDLLELNCLDDCLNAANEAREIYGRRLESSFHSSEDWREACEYAALLELISDVLRDAGRNEESLQIAREAVQVCAWLANRYPGEFDRQVATSLAQWSDRLCISGQYEQAEGIAKQAVIGLRPLAYGQQNVYKDDLALVLTTYRKCLKELGRIEEAHCAAQEVVALYQILLLDKPRKYRSLLTSSLHESFDLLQTIGGALYDQEEYEEALLATQECVRISEAMPDAWNTVLQDRAKSFDTLGLIWGAFGRREEAAQARHQADTLRGSAQP